MKREYYPFVCSVFVGIVIYALFALCYGPVPFDWAEGYKGIFITIELFVSGLVFFVVVVEINKCR